jgi:hypothetical protein
MTHEGYDHCGSRTKAKFRPEYFSGLNWRDLMSRRESIGRPMLFSDDAEDWEGPYNLTAINGDLVSKFKDSCGRWRIYCKTCPVTYVHPTITIAVGWKLPMPEVEAPRHGATVWIITPFHPDGYTESVWQGYGSEQIALEKGCVHLKEDRAQAWANWWKNAIITAVLK